MIKLQNVCKSYFLGDVEIKAVDSVSLEIKKKEFIGIQGASGSGKSTLMHLIGLLEVPSSGKIFLEEKDISRLSDDKLSGIRNETVGFVFQTFNLINRFSVIENILLPTKYSTSSPDFNPVKKAEELLERFGIKHRRDFFPNKISGGEQQRVAIARALIMNPKIILADEPTGNLDSRTGEEIIKTLKNLNKEFGVTVVIVTHEAEVAKKTERIIYVKDGKVVKKY